MNSDLNKGVRLLEARIDSLGRKLERADKRNAELEQERDQLAAQNGRLREATEKLSFGLVHDEPEWKPSKFTEGWFSKLQDALAETAPTSLSEIEAAAIERAEAHALEMMSFAASPWHHGYASACKSIASFAASIRQSAKQEGEPR